MRICFVAPNAYPLLSGNKPEAHVGGAELQQVEIASGLMRRGWDVSFVTRDFGQGAFEEVNGIKVYGAFAKDEGIPVVRFFYPRLVKLWGALKRAKADLYYTRTASFLPGILRQFCRGQNKKYCFAGALDSDFVPSELAINTGRDKWLYSYGLKGADLVTVQSSEQLKLAKKNYGIHPVILKNVLPSAEPNQLMKKVRVLWVATIRNRKQPMRFVALAKEFPQYQFVMIGGALGTQQSLYDDVVSESSAVSNLDFLGFQPFDEVERHFAQASLFVNTSNKEGFPNTFLQAWRRGVPVVSILDPDEVIRTNVLGIVAEDEDELAQSVRMALELRHSNEHIRNYFEKNHGEGLLDQYDVLFRKTLELNSGA